MVKEKLSSVAFGMDAFLLVLLLIRLVTGYFKDSIQFLNLSEFPPPFVSLWLFLAISVPSWGDAESEFLKM